MPTIEEIWSSVGDISGTQRHSTHNWKYVYSTYSFIWKPLPKHWLGFGHHAGALYTDLNFNVSHPSSGVEPPDQILNFCYQFAVWVELNRSTSLCMELIFHRLPGQLWGLIGIYRVLCDAEMKALMLLPNRVITVVWWDEWFRAYERLWRWKETKPYYDFF